MLNLSTDNTVFCMIDMQEKFAPAISGFETAALNIGKLLDAMGEMGIPEIVTEQYPQGLGPTVESLREKLSEGFFRIEKSSFSCFGSEEYRQKLSGLSKENLILCGVESHICVLQTALDAADRGFEVFVVADGVASRRGSDSETALEFLRSKGVNVLGTESLLFFLLKTSSSPFFKKVQKIIK